MPPVPTTPPVLVTPPVAATPPTFPPVLETIPPVLAMPPAPTPPEPTGPTTPPTPDTPAVPGEPPPPAGTWLHLFARQTRDSQQSVVTAQASAIARQRGGEVQTLPEQISDAQQSSVVAHASATCRHKGALPPAPAMAPLPASPSPRSSPALPPAPPLAPPPPHPRHTNTSATAIRLIVTLPLCLIPLRRTARRGHDTPNVWRDAIDVMLTPLAENNQNRRPTYRRLRFGMAS